MFDTLNHIIELLDKRNLLGVFVGVGASLVVLIPTAIINLISVWLTRRSEERIKRNEIVIRAAMENWSNIYKYASDEKGRVFLIYPVELFIFKMQRFFDLTSRKKISAKKISREIDRLNAELDEIKKAMKYDPLHPIDAPRL